MSNRKVSIGMAAVALFIAAFLIVPSGVARADGNFAPGQKVFAARATTAFFNACQPVTPSGSDYRGHQFSARKGEQLTVTANAAGEFRMWCQLHQSWAIRVVNSRGVAGWVYEGNLTPTKPATIVEKVNACGTSVEDTFYTTANRVLASLGSNHFYWKDPNTGVWGPLLWDSKSLPKPYWK